MIICQVIDKLKLVLLFAVQYNASCVHQLKQRINIERRLNWLGTTCAVNGFTAYLPANQNPVFRQTIE